MVVISIAATARPESSARPASLAVRLWNWGEMLDWNGNTKKGETE